MSQLTCKQKLELKDALVIALTTRAGNDGKILGCSADEFADKVVRSFEKRLHEKLSFKRFSIFLN
jgi:hypothetical protein